MGNELIRPIDADTARAIEEVARTTGKGIDALAQGDSPFPAGFASAFFGFIGRPRPPNASGCPSRSVLSARVDRVPDGA
jgi:hypothetical protein